MGLVVMTRRNAVKWQATRLRVILGDRVWQFLEDAMSVPEEDPGFTITGWLDAGYGAYQLDELRKDILLDEMCSDGHRRYTLSPNFRKHLSEIKRIIDKGKRVETKAVLSEADETIIGWGSW